MITFRSWSFFFFLSLIYCTIRTIMTTPRATKKIEINIITAICISRFSDIFFMFVVKVLESTCHLARPNHNLKNDPSQGWKGDCLISAKPHNRTLKPRLNTITKNWGELFSEREYFYPFPILPNWSNVLTTYNLFWATRKLL